MIIRNPEIIWEEPRRHPSRLTITPRSHGYNGMTHIYPRNFDDLHPIKYAHPSTDPAHHPKRHPDPMSRFATVK